MDITLDRAILTSAIKSVRPFLPSTSLVESLKYMLLDVRGNDLTVTAGDGNNFIRCTRSINGTTDGTLLLNGTLLESLLTANGDVVSIAPDGKACTVKIGRSRYKLGLLDPQNYPPGVPPEPTQPLCEAASFRQGVELVQAFASPRTDSEWQKVLHIRVADGRLDFVCGSPRGLAIYRVSGIDPSLAVNVNVSPDKLKAFASAINSDKDMVEVGKSAFFRYGALSVNLGTYEISYPPYEKPLEQPDVAKIEVAKSDLQDALSRLHGIYNDGLVRSMLLSMEAGADEALLSIPHAQLGSGEERIPARLMLGEFHGQMDVTVLLSIAKTAPAGTLTISAIGQYNFKMTSSGCPDWVVLWAGVADN